MTTCFERPRTVDEALALQREYGDAAHWAGGWAISGRRGTETVSHAISLEAIEVDGLSLAGVREDAPVLRIGAMTTLQDIADHPGLPCALRSAAAFQPSRPLRCMLTLGGDVASRRSDSCLTAAIIALGGALELAGDALATVQQYHCLNPGVLILFARIPRYRRCAVACRRRSSRGPILLTAAVGWDERGEDPIVALSGPGLPLCRLSAVEALLLPGGPEASVDEVENVAREALRGGNAPPVGDWLGGGAYKAHLAAVSVADCVAACREGRVCAW